jgi:hypothetical protein
MNIPILSAPSCVTEYTENAAPTGIATKDIGIIMRLDLILKL